MFIQLSELLTNYQRSGTTLVEGTTRTDKQTSTDSTSDGNHLHVSVLQVALELALAVSRADLLIVRHRDGGLVLHLLVRHDGQRMTFWLAGISARIR